MYNLNTELLFPSQVIPNLRDLRGETWQELVDTVDRLDQSSVGHLAFILMMVRLDGCFTCQSDSYRALRGCSQCACQAVARFRGSDENLVEMYKNARKEVERFLRNDSETSRT